MKRLTALMFLLAGVFGAQLVRAQDDAPIVLNVDVPVVSVDVTVKDSKGNPVRNLTKADFSVYEDGKMQEVKHFASTDSPSSTLLLFDRSLSTQKNWPALIEAMNRFIQTLRTADRFALAAFDEKPEMLLDWRARGTGVEYRTIPESGFTTDFYGAIDWALDRSKAENGRRGVIFFTDGQDQLMLQEEFEADEKKAFQKSLTAAEKRGSPFYFVVMEDLLNTSSDARSRARKRMQDLAKVTGGRVYYPKRLTDIAPLYERIAQEMENFYSLGYISEKAPGDGQPRRIEVRLRNKSLKLTQNRDSYNAN